MCSKCDHASFTWNRIVWQFYQCTCGYIWVGVHMDTCESMYNLFFVNQCTFKQCQMYFYWWFVLGKCDHATFTWNTIFVFLRKCDFIILVKEKRFYNFDWKIDFAILPKKNAVLVLPQNKVCSLWAEKWLYRFYSKYDFCLN